MQKTSEVATGLDSIGVYGLYDLVQLEYVPPPHPGIRRYCRQNGSVVEIASDLFTHPLWLYHTCACVCSPATVGVIVKVERDTFKVLDQMGNVKTIPEKEMGRKKNSKFTASLDAKHNTINQNDSVMVIEGVFKVRPRAGVRRYCKHSLLLGWG